MKTLFLIPARGGSKGIPGKNIKLFGGLPLIVHSIEQARHFADDTDICVSTDSEEIAKVVRDVNLDVPFLRPDELATDSAGSYGVILHALDYFSSLGKEYDRVVLLQPTSPLRTIDDIASAITKWTPDIDMAVSVSKAKGNPYYDIFENGEDGFIHISKGEGRYTRRQDAPEVWQYNGAVYVISVSSLRKGPLSSFRRVVASPMSEENSVDLDSPLDWQIGEYLYKKANREVEKSKKEEK